MSQSALLLRSRGAFPLSTCTLLYYCAGTKPSGKWTCPSFTAPGTQTDEDRMSGTDKYPSIALRLGTSHTFMLCPTTHDCMGGAGLK